MRVGVRSVGREAARRRRLARAVAEAVEARELFSAGVQAAVAPSALVAAVTAPAGRVTALRLVDPRTDAVAGNLAGATINLATFGGGKFDARADTSPAAVGSVRFTINGARPHLENTAPYALFDDTGTNFLGGSLPPGQYTVRAVPYAGRDGTGAAGEALSVSFTVVNQPTPSGPVVAGLSLVDARPANPAAGPVVPGANLSIRSLVDGQTLDLAAERTRRLNVRVDLPAGTAAKSVRLDLDGGKILRTRNVGGGIPLTLFGLNDPAAGPTLFAPGQHVLKATAYAGPDGTGAAGAARTIRLTVKDSDARGGTEVYVDLDQDHSLADEAPLGHQDDVATAFLSLPGVDPNSFSGDLYNRFIVLVRNVGSAPVALDGTLFASGAAAAAFSTDDNIGGLVFDRSDGLALVGRPLPNPLPVLSPPLPAGAISPAAFEDALVPGKAKRLSPGEGVTLTLGLDPLLSGGRTGFAIAPRAGFTPYRFTLDAIVPPAPPAAPDDGGAATAAQVAAAGPLPAADPAPTTPVAALVADEAFRVDRVVLLSPGLGGQFGEPVADLTNGSEVNLSTLAGGKFQLAAVVGGGPVDPSSGDRTGTVRLTLDGQIKLVRAVSDGSFFVFNQPPADPSGFPTQLPETLPTGSHTLRVEVFPGNPSGPGDPTAGPPAVTRDVRFVVTNPTAAPAIAGLTLIGGAGGRADTSTEGLPLRSLSDGATVDLGTLPTRRLNIRAAVTGRVGSVRFQADGGAVVTVRNTGPYNVFAGGDAPGLPSLFKPGTHTLTSTPFAGPDAGGAAGRALTVRYTITDSDAALVDDQGNVIPGKFDPLQFYVDFDNDGSLADEAPVGSQNDTADGGIYDVAAFFNAGTAPVTMDGIFSLEAPNSPLRLYRLKVPTDPNPQGTNTVGLADGTVRRSIDDTALLFERNDDFVTNGPDGEFLSERVVSTYVFRDPADPAKSKVLPAGESIQFQLATDFDGGTDKGGAAASKSSKRKKPTRFSGAG